MRGPYDDIIDRPHPKELIHPRMSAMDRAAQFSPFRALTGFEDAVAETARLTDRRIELDADEIEALNRKLQEAVDRCGNGETVSITYFKPDERKAGGSYVTMSGAIRKIEALERSVILADRTAIPIDDIVEISFDTK